MFRGIGIMAAIFCTLAVASQKTETRVKLFGQPCLLTGPSKYSAETLKKIHDVSPEQVPLVRSVAQADKVLDFFIKLKKYPVGLKVYVKQSIEYAQALRSFYAALDRFKSDRKIPEFKKTVRKHAKGRDLAQVDSAIQRALGKKKLDAEAVFVVEQAFIDSIEPAPEVEFHRAIREIGVEYHCTFDKRE